MDTSVLSQLMIYLSHIFYKNNGNNQNVSLQQQQTPKMKICCQDTVVKKQDIYIYKGSNKQHRKKILTPQNQLNPIISHTDEPIMMLAISKEETTLVKCEELKQQYTDLQFMPGSSSIGEYSGRKIQWVRLSRIVSSFILDQYNPATILTLKEGDTYFLASLAALAQTPAIIDEAFDQQLKLSSMGAYKLNVSLNGKPQQIIIDDYLPVFAQNHERSAFAHIDPSHIWVVLFEKVYAKIQGNYRKISFGYAHEVLETFSMSPCLYHLINTDFSHEEQQKVWNILKQSLQMQFPTVIGSRKRFTCNAIVPHQSYCLKTCKIIKNRKGEEKRVYLWNAPGMQQIEQKGISYEKNGDVISLNLVEFMRNFEIIDVAHVRHNYSSLFYQFNCGPTKPIQYAFSTIQKTSFYLTFHRQQGDKGRLRIILINCTNEATYEYVAGKKEEIYDDVTLHIQKLPIGSYVVICQSETDISTLLRVYSQKTVPLLKFTGKKDTLLQRMFMQMAYALPSQQFALSKQHQDWYISKILFEQLGLAFFAVYLDYKSLLKCEISLNNKQLNLQGLRLLNKNIKEGYAMVIQKGQSDIFIFEFIGKDNSSFSFPPSSMKIKVLI